MFCVTKIGQYFELEVKILKPRLSETVKCSITQRSLCAFKASRSRCTLPFPWHSCRKPYQDPTYHV